MNKSLMFVSLIGLSLRCASCTCCPCLCAYVCVCCVQAVILLAHTRAPQEAANIRYTDIKCGFIFQRRNAERKFVGLDLNLSVENMNTSLMVVSPSVSLSVSQCTASQNFRANPVRCRCRFGNVSSCSAPQAPPPQALPTESGAHVAFRGRDGQRHREGARVRLGSEVRLVSVLPTWQVHLEK